DGEDTGLIKIWKDGIGNIPLKELDQQKIERFLSDRKEFTRNKWKSKKEISPSTRNRHLVMLKSMLNKAIEWGLIYENPAAGIKKLREEGGRARFLSSEEIGKLLDNAEERFKPILITALHTGMRRGEILNLKWADVD